MTTQQPLEVVVKIRSNLDSTASMFLEIYLSSSTRYLSNQMRQTEGVYYTIYPFRQSLYTTVRIAVRAKQHTQNLEHYVALSERERDAWHSNFLYQNLIKRNQNSFFNGNKIKNLTVNVYQH